MRGLCLVILDLDGTIFSSRATTVAAVEGAAREVEARHRLGLSVPTEREILRGIGRTRFDFVASVFPRLPREYHEEMDGLIWNGERALIEAGNGSLFPGAREALGELVRDGFRLAIASNADPEYMHTILGHFDLKGLFEECRCAGCDAGEDKGDVVRSVLMSLGVPPARAIMVGDRKSDMDAARKAGTGAVGCAWGFGAPEELAGADRIIHEFAELPPLVRSWR